MRTREAVPDRELARIKFTWLSTAEVGKLCGGADSQTVRSWIDAGLLEAFKMPGKRGDFRVEPEEAARFRREQMVNAKKA